MEAAYYTRQTRRKPQRIIFIIFLSLIALIIAILFLAGFFNHSTVSNPPPSHSFLPYNASVAGKQLEQVIQNALLGTHGSYGIVIKNLKNGENYALREKIKYETASLYKLWIMATVYEQMKDGSLNDNDVLSQDVEVLNKKFKIASESAELTEGAITLSVRDALEKMITISDNYAALLLTEKIRLSSVSLFLKNNGFIQSSVGVNGESPITTPYDIALFFEKLYSGRLINADYSNKMISLLKKQKLNNKIPKYLPHTITIAHKTGELGKYTHDAGIVYANSDDYIIVVLSKSDDSESAVMRIANVSGAVYNYFKTK